MIVVFDGVCNFCNGWVRFVIRRDRQRLFRFAAAQTPVGRQLLDAHGLSADALETIVLVDGDRHYERSDAALRILEQLGGVWSMARILRFLPRALRDGCYDFFARRRYRLFGRSATCQLPEANVSDRFLAPEMHHAPYSE